MLSTGRQIPLSSEWWPHFQQELKKNDWVCHELDLTHAARVYSPSVSPLIAAKKPSKVPGGSMNMCAFTCHYSCEEIQEITLPTAGQVQARHHSRLPLCLRGKQLNSADQTLQTVLPPLSSHTARPFCPPTGSFCVMSVPHTHHKLPESKGHGQVGYRVDTPEAITEQTDG